MKRLILRLGLYAALLLLIAGLCRALPQYREYKQIRGMRQAWGFLAMGDFADASLSARQVLQINPRNVEACGFMARLAQLARSPSAIDWQRRIVEIDPSVGNRLDLVACALRFEHPPYPLAAAALQALASAAEQIPTFHVLSAELALKSNRLGEAAEHFRRAARLEPDNPLHRLNLAVVELQSANASIARSARSELEKLSSQTNVAALALRSLVADQIRQSDFCEAERVSQRLLRLPGALYEDRLQHLTILQGKTWSADLRAAHGSGTNSGVSFPGASNSSIAGPQFAHERTPLSEEFHRALTTLQTEAETKSIHLFALCEWMGSHRLADDALNWLATLNEPTRKLEPISLAEANLYQAKGDWTGLEKYLAKEKWTDLEFLRLALLARAAWGQDQIAVGDARWSSAVAAGGERLSGLMLLLGLADEWGRNPESVLWEISHRFPRQSWVLRELERRYLAKGDTHGLNKVYGRLLEEKNGNTDVTNRNDFACTSLLLGINLPRAHSLARELYCEHPDDVILASTYAYSLSLQGRALDGTAVLARFNERDLQQPSIALYYGLLLAKTGQRERANRFLALAEQVRLSPEEQHLLEGARDSGGTQ